MPAALFASAQGASVILVEADERIGGTFHLSSGQMSAAGTRIQHAKGIQDTPDQHFNDVMRISRGTANPMLVRLAVDHAADTLHWLLDNGLDVLPDHPIIHHGHEPYVIARTYWGPEEGRSVLNAIGPQIECAVAAGAIDLRLQTRLRSLSRASGGDWVATVEIADGTDEIAARDVVLTTGGYTANSALFQELSLGRPLFGGGHAMARGDGLLAARAVGGTVVNQNAYLPTFAAVAEPEAHGGMTFATQTYPQFRAPWEVYVDGAGRRFVREDEPSPDARERALLALPDMTFWAIFDDAVRRDAPNFFTTASWDAVAPRFNDRADYRSADTIEGLAATIGVDPGALAATVDAYNDALVAGAPDPLGREYRPRPLTEPPFYAVRHRGWSIVGFAGLGVDGMLRIVDTTGQPIGGLYAAGEVLGLGATAGNAFAGGMSVMPAMTFGRLLGQRLGAAAVAVRAA